jgi:hypothetical protein
MTVNIKTNIINDKLDNIIDFIENKIIKNVGVRIMNKLETVGAATQQIHQVKEQFDTLIHPKKQIPSTPIINNSPVAKTIGAAGLLSVFNIPKQIITIIKSIKAAIATQSPLEKLDASLSVAESATSLVGTVNSIISGLSALNSSIKVADIAANVFAGFSLSNSVLGLVIRGRSIYRTQKCYNKLKKIRNTDYKSLNTFFTDEKNIEILGIKKSVKFKQEANKLVDNTHKLNEQEQNKVDTLIKDLKVRLKTQNAIYSIGIITNCLSLVNAALIIASVACPPLIIVAATFSTVTSISIFLYKQITDYKFEQKMGMTDKCPKDLEGNKAVAWKVNHFFKWNIQSIFLPA